MPLLGPNSERVATSPKLWLPCPCGDWSGECVYKTWHWKSISRYPNVCASKEQKKSSTRGTCYMSIKSCFFRSCTTFCVRFTAAVIYRVLYEFAFNEMIINRRDLSDRLLEMCYSQYNYFHLITNKFFDMWINMKLWKNTRLESCIVCCLRDIEYQWESL